MGLPFAQKMSAVIPTSEAIKDKTLVPLNIKKDIKTKATDESQRIISAFEK